EKGVDIPVIMLTERKESVDKIKGLTIGASDYISKPFDSGELVARVKVLLRVQELQEELKEKNALLEKMVITDALTGLHNRRYFFDILKMQMAIAKRYRFPIACLVMDIDHFKRINDTYGHSTGDIALKGVAEAISSTKRDGELLARIGGEEFALCLFKTDETGGIQAAERIRKTVESCNLTKDENRPIRVTVSIGLSSFPGDGIDTIDDLLNAADKAMYQAKRAGRNRVVTYSEVKNQL
ncbi:MAG: diguanylate cyclase, partial [Deltaproteobacteria bacterium]|nr:diguanylate cyclase [Deltaproteobacteria bacterium]